MELKNIDLFDEVLTLLFAELYQNYSIKKDIDYITIANKLLEGNEIQRIAVTIDSF